ncbi:hypothetical protein ACV36C_34170, partial [Pseudomonas aeruginosa]
MLTLRNRLPFTRVHSHAGTQKSSGAFFLDMGTERCMFQAGGLRNALRAFEACLLYTSPTHETPEKKKYAVYCLKNKKSRKKSKSITS